MQGSTWSCMIMLVRTSSFFLAAQTAFLEALSHDSAAAVSAQPHVMETLAPCLQGPLNLNAASLKPSTARRIACTMALSSSGSEGLDGQPGASFSALLTGFSSGTVYAHALQLEHLVPCWQDTSPQVRPGWHGLGAETFCLTRLLCMTRMHSTALHRFSSGTVYAHALQLEHLVPCWQDTSSQVRLGWHR
jgi:hypothetical protein